MVNKTSSLHVNTSQTKANAEILRSCQEATPCRLQWQQGGSLPQFPLKPRKTALHRELAGQICESMKSNLARIPERKVFQDVALRLSFSDHFIQKLCLPWKGDKGFNWSLGKASCPERMSNEFLTNFSLRHRSSH